LENKDQLEMRLSIVVIVIALAIGGIVAISGFVTNQEINNISELSEISNQYVKLEKYKNELEKINQYNQQVLADLENQIKNSDNEQIEQINEEIKVVKRVINDNKAELEQVIQRLSKMESNP